MAGAVGVDTDRRWRVRRGREDRFFVAIAKRADETLHEDGTIYFNLGELEQIARELDVPNTIGRHVLRQLDDDFLLTSENGHEVALALRGEQGERIACRSR